jgi:glycosyltransferase involved in cell wall biosynthesis
MIKMDQEITFSIIIPHKNTPELLQRCLASIPKREDIQIIVIDDNSDNTKVDFEYFPG